MSSICRFLLMTSAIMCCGLLSTAQDTHYNTQQFGTRSALMGGAVIGGVKDNTAIFYNPGSIGFIDTSSLSINANLYRLENIRIKNAVGNEKDFKGINVGTLPLLVSGMFKSKNPRLKLGYGFAAPVDFQFKANARIAGNYQIAADTESPGLEEFIGQGLLQASVNETLVGMGIGYLLNEHWSIGITNQLVVRNHQFTDVRLTRFYLNTPALDLVSSNIWKTMKYFHMRYVPKIGIAYSAQKWDVGLTISAPGIRVLGSGSVAADVAVNDVLYQGQRRDVMANDAQEKLKAKFKSPLKIGGGLNYKTARSVIGLSAEWCGAIKSYDVIRAKPAAFVRPVDLAPDLQSEDLLRVKESAKQVINLSIGYEYFLKPQLSLIGSIRTDNSWFDSDILKQRGIKPQVSTWDIYHFTMGATFTRKRSTLSLGLLVSTGSDKEKSQGGNLSQPDEGNFLQGKTTITEASYSSFGFLFGYTFSFRKF
jgi:hypothetical protein